MRQVGLLAAAGIYALENNIERLKKDHVNASRFADLFRGCEGLTVDYDEAGTNLLFIHCHGGAVDPLEFLKRLEEVNLISSSEMGCDQIKFVTVPGQVTESEVAALGQGSSLMAITMGPTTIRYARHGTHEQRLFYQIVHT